MSDFMFRLGSPVGNNMPSKINDVRLVRRALSVLGLSDPNLDAGYIDRVLDDNIRRFQYENSLKPDGHIQPGGETEAKINEELILSATRSPTFWCTKCGAPHGGSQGGYCPDCTKKSS